MQSWSSRRPFARFGYSSAGSPLSEPFNLLPCPKSHSYADTFILASATRKCLSCAQGTLTCSKTQRTPSQCLYCDKKHSPHLSQKRLRSDLKCRCMEGSWLILVFHALMRTGSFSVVAVYNPMSSKCEMLRLFDRSSSLFRLSARGRTTLCLIIILKTRLNR